VPYTFGAATADDVTFASATNFQTGRIIYVSGWWRATTLTSGRGLWGNGNSFFYASVNSTTSELRMFAPATVNGEWTTPGLVVNEWRFLAFALTILDAGNLAAWRIWSGSLDTAPQEQTVTQVVAPSGGFTSGGASMYIGARGTGLFAFQGDVSDVTIVVSSATVGATTHPLGIAAAGVISNDEAQHMYETMVQPAWLGDISAIIRRPVVGDYSSYHVGLANGGIVVGGPRASATLAPVLTTNGATWSQNGAPRPNPGMDIFPRPRR
jgi:hypothetical protein